ncbi:YfhO family protein [Cystobacter ferrugineus]|uniref:YfhO family protein n=1 Tax=Cystobacter ferrugineus TaxID=83449 RepID=UPI000903F0D0|nr:YfhO family protein [Cystobacter ferrugineus]
MSSASPEPLQPEAAPPRWLLPTLSVGLTLLFFHRAVFSANVFFLRDVQQVYVPLWEYWRERVLGGEFPQWYPFDGLGQPYVGMVVSGAFHPAQALSLVLPGAQGLKWLMLLCFPVAFLGMSALGRRLGWGLGAALLAAVSYTFSGYLVSITNNTLYLLAAVTVPWVFWALEGFLRAPTVGRGLGVSVLLGLVLLAGDVQGYAVCLGGALLWSVSRPASGGMPRALLGMLGVGAVSVLLCAVQILPTLAGLGEVRASNQPLEQAMVWSVHPLRLVELLLGPLFAGESGERVQVAISAWLLATSKTELWADSLYLGAPALALAGVAVTRVRGPRAALLLAAALGVVLLALGKHTPLYRWVFDWVPPWRTFRYPEKLMTFVTFAVCLAAGVGWERLEHAPDVRRLVGRGLLGLGGLVLAVGGAEWLGHVFSEGLLSGMWMGPPWPEAQRRIGEHFVRGCGLAGGSLLALGGILGAVRSAGARAGLVGVVGFGGMLLANGGIYKVGEPELFDEPTPFVLRIQEELREQGGPPPRVYRLMGRYYTPRPLPLPTIEETNALVMGASLMPLVPALFGLESSSAFMPAVSRRVADVQAETISWVRHTAGLFHTRYFVLSTESSEVTAHLVAEPLRVLDRLDAFGLWLVEDPNALPRVYLSHPRCVAGPREALRRLGSVQAPREVVVECVEPLPEPPLEAPRGEVTAARFAPERVEVEVRARGGEVLVLNDAYYGGWTASVDGEPVPILPANGAVRAVAVPPGEHQVVFRYRTPGLALGAGVSLGTLLVLLGVDGVLRRRLTPGAGRKGPRAAPG